MDENTDDAADCSMAGLRALGKIEVDMFMIFFKPSDNTQYDNNEIDYRFDYCTN